MANKIKEWDTASLRGKCIQVAYSEWNLYSKQRHGHLFKDGFCKRR